MSKGKLVLDTFIETNFELLAIHCSLEPYRMAYFMNKQLGLKLQRIQDVEIFTNNVQIEIPLYHYFDALRETDFFLVANKYKSQSKVSSKIDLFGETRDQFKEEALINEHRSADYFLKIEDDVIESIPLKKFLSEINQLKHVVATYKVDLDILKHKDRLTFR